MYDDAIKVKGGVDFGNKFNCFGNLKRETLLVISVVSLRCRYKCKKKWDTTSVVMSDMRWVNLLGVYCIVSN